MEKKRIKKTMEAMFLFLMLLIAVVSSLTQQNLSENTESQVSYEDNFQGQLVQNLLAKYGKGYIRPVRNTSTVTKVIYRLLIHELVHMDSKNQRITISALLKQTWKDELLEWNPTQYGDIKSIQLPSDILWVPDITLHRNIDGDFERIKSTKATVDNNGMVFWFAPAIFTSSCRITVRYFPFDTQQCQFRFGSWAYNGLEIDLFPETGKDSTQDKFLENGVWDLKNVTIEREVQHYTCCPEPYPELVFTLVLKRRSNFYISYLILPCVFLSVLSLLVFYLPPECGEKLTLSITNLLALVVFQQLIAESMPPSGDDPPLIGDYFLAMISMVCLSVLLTVVVINISARTTKVPWLIRVIVLKILARITCMYRKDCDIDPEDTSNRHDEIIYNCELKYTNDDATTKDEPILLKANGVSPGGMAGLESLKDDLKFIRRDFELKSLDEVKVIQWKHVARVVDRCLLLAFLVYATCTSFILISRARGPGE